MLPHDGGISLRRNGRQQACEPCRVLKVACDHTRPHCNRCVRRQAAAKCIYHPAPMTRTRAGPDRSRPPILKNSSRISPHVAISGQSRQGSVPAPSRSELNHPAHISPISDVTTFVMSHAITPGTTHQYDRKTEIDTALARKARYYGPTSFSSVFIENDLLDGIEDLRIHPLPSQLNQPLPRTDMSSAPAVRRNQIIMALSNIPSQDMCESLMGRKFESHYHITLNPVMMRHAVARLWSTFGEQLSSPRTAEKLNLVADTLFKNEEKPLPPPPDDGMEWLNTFIGLNLRFEMLGLLFCFFGMAYQFLLDGDRRLSIPENKGRDRKQLSWGMKECADICLKMCEISETNNEISSALRISTLILESLCSGDESFQLRRRHADTIVSVVAAGLHRLDLGANKLTAALEYKRRLISAVYATDKLEASMNGVPFSLSQKLIHLRLPLDLSDEELLLPQENLVKAANQLDYNGWNKGGQIHHVTTQRGTQLLSRCREEILELALGVDQAISPQQINDLRSQCQQVYDSLPPQLHYYEEGTMPKKSTGKTLQSQAYLMLINLQNMFLIDRVATARGFGHDQKLVDTAMEMLEISIMFWVRRDDLVAFYSNLDCIATCYGIPSSGVVCVELLKQTKGQSRLELSLTDAIQRLTVFIRFLEWIRPADGNYLLARRLKTVVKCVVDHVLDPPQSPPKQDFTENYLEDVDLDPMLAPLDADMIDWLNTIDWTEGSWMEFN